MLRSCILSLSLVLACPPLIACSPAAAREIAPRPASVKSATAQARSGPGNQFYATQPLRPGEAVEIYRRKPDGWCAVRPPKGSFSYVRADHVRPTESSDLLEVTKGGTKTRVGSRLTRAFKVEYIALRKGEHLQLLGDPVRLGKSGQAWYRVAPPSGEFRWIHESDLQLLSPVGATAPTANTPPLVPNPTDEETSPAGTTEPADKVVTVETPLSDTLAAANRETSPSTNLSLPAPTSPAPRPPAPSSVAGTDENDGPTAPSSDGTPIASSAETTAATETELEVETTVSLNERGLQLEKLARPAAQMTTEPILRPEPIAPPTATLAAHHQPPGGTEGQTMSGASDEQREPSAWTVVAAEPIRQKPAPPRPAAIFPSSTTPERTLSYQPDADQRLADLDLALSQIVTQEVHLWNLQPLYEQVSAVMTLLPDARGRQDARLLLERVEEFARLQQRHIELSTPTEAERAQTVSFSEALAARPTPTALAPNVDTIPPDPPSQFFARQAAIERHAENVHYAGQGWLVPVISSRTDLPRFALTDEKGSILAFVSPRPGLNLRRYQRREVGIVGRETMRTDDEAAHLLAERIVVLERHNRR